MKLEKDELDRRRSRERQRRETEERDRGERLSDKRRAHGLNGWMDWTHTRHTEGKA